MRALGRVVRERGDEAVVAADFEEVERRAKAPLYLRGSRRLKPYPDGTRVTLVLFFDSRQWPVNPADGVFSPERMAAALLGLGK